MAARLFAKPNR